MDHASRQHSPLGASGAHRWMPCAASVRLLASVPPQPSSVYAVDGEEAHEILDYALKHKLWDSFDASLEAGWIERDAHPDKEDRLPSVQMALDYVAGIMASYDDAILYVEQPFKFPSNVSDDAWGTNDILIYIPSLKLLYVIDYKHGAGRLVEVIGNKQLRYYATGAVLGDTQIDADTIVLVIVQPRCRHPSGKFIREEVVTRNDLIKFAVEVDQAILRTQDPNAPFNPGPTQCEWCAKLACPAYEAASLMPISNTFRTVRDVVQQGLPSVDAMSVERLTLIEEVSPALYEFLAAAHDALYQRALAGDFTPGFKLIEAQARRHWHITDKIAEPDVAAALMRLANTGDWDKVYPRKLIGITEAETLIKAAFKAGKTSKADKAKAAEDAVQAMAALTLKQSSGNLSLVPLSHRSPAVNRSAVAFKSVQMLPPPQ